MKKLSLVFAAAIAVGMSLVYSARADVLVYEGFAKSDYNIGEAAGNQGTANDFPGANVSAIGTSTSKWAGMGGSQIKVYGSYYGLSLPSALTDAGFTSTGGSIGTNNGSNSSDLRAMYHALATDVLKVSSGKLFVRMLLSIDSKAAGKLNVKSGPVNASGGYYGFGVMKAPSGNDYSLLCQNKSPSAIGFGIWKDSNGCNLSLMLTDVAGASTNYEVIHGIAMDTTYICYAELSLGAGVNGAEVVRAGAQTVADYESPVVWANIGEGSDSVEVDVISDTVYPNAMGVVGPYGSNGGFFRADEIRIGTKIDDVLVDAVAGAPQLDGAMLSGANGSYTVGDMVIKAAATDAGALAEDSNGTFVKFSVGAVAENGSIAADIDLSRLSADTTYQLYSYAENDVAAATNKAGIIYSGNLSIVKVKDANEYQCEAGEITVSRASADGFALIVPYTITAKVEGKGAEGQTWEAPVDVVIPAGETSATLIVKPIVDATIGEDIEVVVAAGSGKYTDFSPATVDVTIANVAFPAGYNTWSATADGLASDPNNWSEGHAPLSSENVLFDGNFSSANCEWDVDATSTVASWTQRNGYAGTVTLKTVFPGKGDFTCLTVTGAMTVDAGALTHPQSWTQGGNNNAEWDWLGDLKANETYRIRIACGSLSVGAAGSIDVKTKGYYASHDSARCYAAHGGTTRLSAAVYDDPKEPVHIGLPHRTAGNYWNGKGGGAIYITSTGAVTVNGAISADSGNSGHGAGAAGSVYIKAPSVTGAGSITARGSGSGEGNYKGTGGRVAIVTETPVDRTTFAAISAECEWKNSQGSRATEYGGPGTVYFKDSTMTNGKLVIAAKSDITAIDMTKIARQTFVGTDGDWTFDSIEFGRMSYLFLPVGTTLKLPNGLASVSGTGTGNALGGIIYEGGTFDYGTAATQTISGNWILTGWSNLVINADVVVDGGAAIGVPQVETVSDSGSSLPSFMTSSVTINGILTVNEDGRLLAYNCGCRKTNQWVSQGVLGHAAHGGRIMAAMNQDITCKGAYDSVFSPSLPGCSIPWPNGQGVGNSGGVMKLVVSGTFTMNGVANASGSPESHNQGGNAGGGAGGAIDITAGSIAGNGQITADGGSYGWMSGPGGRIAVKLTDSGADFSEFTGLIRATGRSRGSHGGAQGSAGTIYLKTGDEDAYAGTIRIACPKYDSLDNWSNKTSTTEIVSLGYGGDAVADYKHVKVEVRDFGRAAVNADVTLAQMTVATADAKLDLEGHTLTVNTFRYPVDDGNGGTKLAKLKPGTYTLDQLKALGINCVYDSVGGGKLVVTGTGLMLLVR